MLGGIFYCVEIAKKREMFLIIDSLSADEFKMNFSDIFIFKNNISYSDKYDAIPKNYTYKGYSIEDIKNYSVKYSRLGGLGQYSIFDSYFISNTPKVEKITIFAGPRKIKKLHGLKVTEKVKKEVVEKASIPEKYISVHFRNTDRKNDLSLFIKKIKSAIKRYKINTIYLASDDYCTFYIIKKEIKNITLIRNTIPPRNIHSLHYSSKDKYEDKYKQVVDCLVDIYVILNSNVFIPSYNSGLSRFIINMIKNNENIFDIDKVHAIIVSQNIFDIINKFRSYVRSIDFVCRKMFRKIFSFFNIF
jgi:hypothetical protein